MPGFLVDVAGGDGIAACRRGGVTLALGQCEVCNMIAVVWCTDSG